MQNKKRAWLLAISILLLGIIINNVLSRQKQPMNRKPLGSKQKSVRILTVQNGDVPTTVYLTGPLYAYNKIELYAEVSGVLQETQKRFKEGFRYQKGDVLLKIDDRVYKNNMLAQKSGLLNQITLLLPDLSIDFPESAKNWEAYLETFDFDKPLEPLPNPDSNQERYYIAARNIYNQFFAVKAMEETLAKYTLRAPFNGVVTEANINPGTLVRTGQKLGAFASTSVLEMEGAVGIREVGRLRVGQEVTLTSEIIKGEFAGKIQRINPVIDRTTMTAKVFIHTRDTRLTDGMYLNARIQASPIKNAFAIPRYLVFDGDKIFTIENSVLAPKEVEIVAELGDQVIIRGLADGTRILGETWAEAREGVKLPSASKPPNASKLNPQE